MTGIMDHWPQNTGGRPLDYTPEVGALALWPVALGGGEERRGHVAPRRALVAQAGLDEDDVDSAGVDCPAERTVRNWVTGRFRNRYHEILEVKASELDGHVAATATELAIAIEEGERQALKQTLAGLGNATGVDA